MVVLGISYLLGGCRKEDSYESSYEFNTGKQSFEHLENNMAAILSFFDLSLRMNAYLDWPEEEQAEALRECFPDYQIQLDEEGNWIGVKEQNTVFRVVTDGLDLTTETAVWKLDGCCEAYHGAMTIICTGWGNWTLETQCVINGVWKSEAYLRIKYQGEQMPVDFEQGDWVISGSGKSAIEEEGAEWENEWMRFEIGEHLAKLGGSRYLFDRGVLYLTLQNAEYERQEYVKAELKPLLEKGRQLQITYRGQEKIYSDEGLPAAAGTSSAETSSAESAE